MKVICFLFDPHVGGPTIRARAVYQHLLMRDAFDVAIAFPRNEGTALDYFLEAGLAAERLPIDKPVLPRKVGPFLRFVVSTPVTLWRLRRYLKKERPDVIHVNGAFDVLPAIAGRLSGCAVVWHLNDTVFGSRLSRILGHLVKRVAHVVIVAAERVGNHYGVSPEKWHVVHAPVDVERFPARPLADKPNEDSRLTMVGNWNWIKGQDHFVDVVSSLHAEGHSVTGQVIGRFLDGQETFWQPIVDRIKNDDLGSIVETPGFVADIPGVLATSDLLLLTSHSEASPMVVLEAMSTGVPVVTFDVGGVREQLGVPNGDGSDHADAAGLVVLAGDTDAMKDACARLLHEPALWRRLAENGQKRARAHFSLVACANRHLEAYDEAMATQRLGKGEPHIKTGNEQ